MNNWSEEDYKEYLDRRKKRNTKIVPPKKPSKMHNIITEVNGIKFDSKKEAERYCELCMLKQSGQIVKFELQPEFVLQDKFKTKDGEAIRAIKYFADFKVLYPDRHVEVEDVKSAYTQKDKTYRLKVKLLKKKFPDIIFKEVL